MAPSLNERSWSGMIRSGSKYLFVPSPLHSGHAPCGLLNENIWGVNSGMLIPHWVHAAFWLKKISPEPITSRTACPPERLRVSSMESVRRRLISLLTMRRSTTTLIWCFLFLSKTISSSRSLICPSILTLVNPSFRSRWRSWVCAPFLPSIKGAKICTLVPSFMSMI